MAKVPAAGLGKTRQEGLSLELEIFIIDAIFPKYSTTPNYLAGYLYLLTFKVKRI